MQTLIDPEQFVGLRGNVEPRDDDPFMQEFNGLCVGVRGGFLQVRDSDGYVFEVEVAQFTPGKEEDDEETTGYRDNERDRKTGRSTARRLLALGYACLAAGTEVEFKDHMPNTYAQARRHHDILKRYIEALQLPARVVMRGSRVFVSVSPDAEVSIER